MTKPIAAPASEPTKGSLLAVFLTVFIDLLGFGIVLPLLPLYAKNFSLDDSGVTVGLLMASFSAMQFIFAPIWGRLSDRIGRRPVLLIGLMGSTLFYAVFGVATMMGSLAGMFISRIGAGIAGATISTAQAYIADSTSNENRTRGMALIGAAFGLGFTFGPLLAAAALHFSPDDVGRSPWPGFVASALSACAFLFAFFKLPESKPKNTASRKLRWLDFSSLQTALKTPTILPLLLTSFVSILSLSNFEGVISFLLGSSEEEGGFGYKIKDVMLIFTMLGFMHAFSQGFVRIIAKRMSEERLATVGALIAITGFTVLTYATSESNFNWLVVGLLVAGAGFAFIPPAMQSLISRRSDPAAQGGILGVGQSLGAMARILGHGICIPLFAVKSTMPFIAGGGIMCFALLLIIWSTGRGSDFVVAEQSQSSE